ncbi:MAG: hypothetical protein K1060chlam1_00661 [Candidatus Anoxychlamydiales bacterium]|nr:hypothetical protein [Candidatus Anoxychlamydiales bacterium]
MSSVTLSKPFSSYDAYTNFMSGQEAISKLRAVALSEKSEKSIDKFPYLKKVVSIFYNYLLIIKYSFLCTVNRIYYGPFKKKGNPYFRRGIIARKTINWMRVFGNNFLVPTTNCVQTELVDISMDLREVDEEIKERFSEKFKDKISLKISDMQKDGICRGMSVWFDFLYMSTIDTFKDKSPETHIKAVAELFRYGSPIEGCLMQELVMVLPIQKYTYHTSSYAQKYVKPFENIENTVDILKQLPIGNYGLHPKTHVCNLFKVSDDCMYLWDPNTGLIKIQGTNVERALLDILKKYVEGGTNNGFCLFRRDSIVEDYRFSGEIDSEVKEVKPGIFIFEKPQYNSPAEGLIAFCQKLHRTRLLQRAIDA